MSTRIATLYCVDPLLWTVQKYMYKKNEIIPINNPYVLSYILYISQALPLVVANYVISRTDFV